MRKRLLLLLLFLAHASAASAQIQLAPPTLNNAAKAQIADTADNPPTGAAPAPAPAPAPDQPAAPAQGQPPAEAPKQTPPDFDIVKRITGLDAAPVLEAWAARLNAIDPQLNNGYVSYGTLRQAREALDGMRADIDKFMGALAPKVTEAKAQVDKLGPVPQGGEPEAVAAQRAELQTIYGSLSATRNIAESTKLRAGQLAGTIQDLRRKKFAERLFERVPETLSLDTWIQAPGQLQFALTKAWQMVAGWWMHLDRYADALQLILLALVIGGVTSFAAIRGMRHFRQWDEPEPPAYWRRSTSAAWVMLLRLLPLTATLSFLYFSFHYQGLMPNDIDRLAYSALRSLLIVTAVYSLITTVLVPRRPEWRLVAMDSSAARRVRGLVVALAVLYAFTLLLDTIRFRTNAPFTLTIAQGFLSSVLIACLVIAILRTPRNVPETDDAPDVAWLRQLRFPLWIVAIVILVTAVAGYIGLARFISAQLIVTGTILSLLYLLTLWADAVGSGMSSEDAPLGKWLKAKGLDQRRREQLALPVVLLLKAVAFLVTGPLILLQWGFDWKDVLQAGESLFFGFRVGNTQISIAAILAAIVVFGVGYSLARFFQGWLDRRVLETAGISGGARHSISTVVNYAGVIIAGLIAISYAGIDLSNIALVAGALSVGIGLGLQGVVNNFVSGMILLVERPIKVGDWVVVGNEEGIVKKISVRATEIETFDRANVLVPNASFITEKVKNWTLHNYSGRIAIPVGVHYHSDPRKVHETLLAVAKANPNVMTNPAPFAYFGNFGADVMEFTLYAYTYDITKSLALRTELRIAILEAFQQAGIDMLHRSAEAGRAKGRAAAEETEGEAEGQTQDETRLSAPH